MSFLQRTLLKVLRVFFPVKGSLKVEVPSPALEMEVRKEMEDLRHQYHGGTLDTQTVRKLEVGLGELKKRREGETGTFRKTTRVQST